MVTVEIPWRRGGYVARLAGEDAKFGVRRDFVTGRPIKSRGVLSLDLDPGWYEWQARYGAPREHWAVDELKREVLPPMVAGILDKVSVGPLPGEDGCWNGHACRCGAEVTQYDGDGWPYCDGCWEA